MDLIRENWTSIKEAIKEEYNITDISYKTWVEPLSFYNITDNTINIVISKEQSHHALSYISSKYKNFFKVTISEMFGVDYDINFIMENDKDDYSHHDIPSPINFNENYENSNLDSKYKFDSFVVGSNNRFAHSAALAVAESPGELYNPLFIYGGPGLGKTHLIHSIGNYIIENNPNKKVLYVTSEDFTNDVIDSIRHGTSSSMSELREKYRTVDVLIIDDVQFIIGKESTQEEFFHTFNVLHSANKAIIITSDKPPKDMVTLEERFRSRFEWGLIADIQVPDYETRVAILKKQAEKFDKKIDDEIFQYIASNIKTNIRELEGAFTKIIAFAKLNNVELTKELAEEALKDVIYPNKSKEVTCNSILNTVAEHYNISPEDIKSKKRNAEFVIPRQVVMYLCRTLTEDSLSYISNIVGKNDHTTVINGYKKIKEYMETSEEMNKTIEIIMKKIIPS
ncbi:MAG: chromosomal replication initiator protein DnaA [Lachnospiraceae bacterium]|nr:chromosomal replication initiator protein DnaA [Lachnospiraceae bacterium]